MSAEGAPLQTVPLRVNSTPAPVSSDIPVAKPRAGRMSLVELLRFLCCFGIVWVHIGWISGLYGYEWSGEIPFHGLTFLVELFYLITGYFTVRHFAKRPLPSLDAMAGEALGYTVRKFKVFIPYIVIAVVLIVGIDWMDAIRHGNDFSLLHELREGVFDFFIYTSDQIRLNDPLWFLTAMVAVFPLFSVICQLKQRNMVMVVTFTALTVFYGSYDIDCFMLYRAFAGLMSGYVVFYLSDKLQGSTLTRPRKATLTLGFFAACALALWLMRSADPYSINRDGTAILTMLCFIFGMTALLSEQTPLSKFSSKFVNYLGALSLPVYILHRPVAAAFALLLPEAPTFALEVVLYFAAILALSAIIYLIIAAIKKAGKHAGR